MTFEQLRTFHAVVTEGGFRAAAEKLGKSQPALSRAMQKLERTLGVKLLSRDEYRPRMTAAGEVFFRKASIVLQQVRELEGLSGRFADQDEPLVRIAINGVCPMQAILERLRTVEQEYPATRINLSTESLSGAIERLYDETADMVVTVAKGVSSDFMEAVPLMAVPVVFVAHRDFPPAQRQGVIPVAEMDRYVQVLVADSSHRQPKPTLDSTEGARIWTVTDFDSKKAIIKSGMGWGGMPEHTVRDELTSGELVEIHVEGFAVRHSEQFLVRRTDRRHGPVAQAIWDALVQLDESSTSAEF